MLPELDFFIKNNYSDIVQESLFLAFDLLEDLNVPELQDDFLELIMVYDEKDQKDVKDEFLQKIHAQLDAIVALHGITLSHECILTQKIEIITGLIELPFYLDKHSIVDILDTSSEPVEKLIDLLLLVTNLDKENSFTLIDSVNTGIFETLTSLVSVENNKTPIDPLHIEYIKLLRTVFEGYTPFAFSLIESNVRIGMEFKAYLNYLSPQFYSLKPYDQAKELMAFLYMSKDGIMNPLNTYNDHSSELFDNIDIITKVSVQINRVILEVDKYKLTLRDKK